jgi:hypothetical protein
MFHDYSRAVLLDFLGVRPDLVRGRNVMPANKGVSGHFVEKRALERNESGVILTLLY